MAVFEIPVHEIKLRGVKLVYLTSSSSPALATGTLASASGGLSGNQYIFWNDGRTLLRVKNSTAAPKTLSIETVPVVGSLGLNIADRSETIAASSNYWLGPFTPSLYGEQVQFAVSNANGVSIAAVRLPTR